MTMNARRDATAPSATAPLLPARGYVAERSGGAVRLAGSEC